MTTWTNISDSVLEPGDPIRSVDIIAIKENPIAIAEGASGAPRIADAALGTTVTSAGTNWVLARTAGASVGAVGTYAWVFRSGTGLSEGSTIAGSGLNYAGFATSNQIDVDSEAGIGATRGAATLAGTWRIMGRSMVSSGNTLRRATLALRIS